MHLVFSKYNNQYIYFTLLLILLLSFGMIFNKAHVAFAGHQLGECHIHVALKFLNMLGFRGMNYFCLRHCERSSASVKTNTTKTLKYR